MKWTFRLGKIYNIPIKIHALFILLLIFFWYINTRDYGIYNGVLSTVFVLLIFLFVTLHEFAHGYQAMKYGIKVREIVLLPIGGVAQIENFPEEPLQEIKVAIAGPLLNFFSAGIIFSIFLFSGKIDYLMDFSITSTNIVKSLFWVNLMLGVFNLIPAFPMDGGRILRAVFALNMPYIKATRLAAGIGKGFAILFGLYGLFANWWLILIAIFIFLGAGSEEHMLKVRNGLEGIMVRQIMTKNVFALRPDDSLKQGLQYIYQGCMDDFLVLSEEKIIGIVARADLMSAIHEFGLNKKIEEIMSTDFEILSPEDKVVDVYAKLSHISAKTLPVAENEKIVGMIGLENIGRYLTILDEIKERK